MRSKFPTLDPTGAYRRKAVATRRLGVDARCSCGEDRPEALIEGSVPTICSACERLAKAQTTMDQHHYAGRGNNPATISVPVNDHRADLSASQAGWPKSTLRNPNRSPLLAGAACVRGFIDTVSYLIETGLVLLPDMLEKLDALLRQKLGPKWWAKTEIEQYAPKKKRGAKS